MINNKMKTLCALALAVATSPTLAGDKQAQRMEKYQACQRAVLEETAEFAHLPASAISLSKHNDGIKWHILWDGETANGVCVFKKKQFRQLKIKNHLRDSSRQSRGKSYVGAYGGFYYDRHIGQWRDPDGVVCHTCTPDNGFPANGGLPVKAKGK